MDFPTQLNERHLLVERANRLIEKHSLPVPRFFSTRFINFQFWSNVFIRIFGIKCDISLRTPSERVNMLRSCLNTLECLIGQTLDHIRPECVLNFDVATIQNLLEIAEVWDDSFDSTRENLNVHSPMVSGNDRGDENGNPFDYLDIDNISPSRKANTNALDTSMEDKQYSNKSQELADMLYKSLKNQILALEIEKKIKLYLGDVTASKQNFANLRASRQSIVRTRAIQPTSTFDFSLKKIPKRNHVLSVELGKLFPEISGEVLNKIRHQEQMMQMSQRNIRIWHENLAMNKVSRTLNEIIDKQRQRVNLSEKETKEEDRATKAKNERKKQILLNHSVHQIRLQKALLQKEIDDFSRESTAAYLNARSHLERILMIEFRKIDAFKKQEINEVRKYLQNHYEVETDNLRSLLENYDSM